MKATEQYFPVVQFIMLYKVVLTFESVDEILKCDDSVDSYWAALSCGTVSFLILYNLGLFFQFWTWPVLSLCDWDLIKQNF